MNQTISDILDSLNADELIAVKVEIEKRLEELKADKIKQLANELKVWGISASELNGHVKEADKSPVAAKYRNPDNYDSTWSGRGKPPNWFKDALDNGVTKDDMLILK